MGWIGSADTQAQVRLSFPTREEAVAYAEKNGIAYDLELPQPRRVQAEGVCRQFPLWADRELDALTGMTGFAVCMGRLGRARRTHCATASPFVPVILTD